MRVCNAFLVTRPAQAPPPHPTTDSLISQGFYPYPRLLITRYLPNEISDSLLLLVTVVTLVTGTQKIININWLHKRAAHTSSWLQLVTPSAAGGAGSMTGCGRCVARSLK